MKGFKEDQHFIKAWSREGLLLESYHYAPGPAESLPNHSHEEYQFCLSLDFPGEYRYRKERHPVPVGSLSVIHPGEVHSARDPYDRETSAAYRVMYAAPTLLEGAAAEVTKLGAGSPFFSNPIVLDRDLAQDFLHLHRSLEGWDTRLEQDSRLLSMFARFIQRHADVRPSPQHIGDERRAVRLVREYLEDNLAENVSLGELASLAGLSRYHLARVFRKEVGVPPHAYQIQARLARAKVLLLCGWPAGAVAYEVGFADQGHFSRRFKSFVGVTPGSYAGNSKNVQDGSFRARQAGEFEAYERRTRWNWKTGYGS